ncbi:MAG TPA: RDD family protein [Polyangia bacterium]|nr:RDD family protein [Polyangia bacterium]
MPRATSTSSLPPSPSPATRPTEERVIRVRVTGFPRRCAAVIVDAGLLLACTVGVTLVAALALRVAIPGPRELGVDLLVAGILDRNPMAVGALGLFLGMQVLYQLYFAGIAGQTLGMRLVGIRLISGRARPPGAARGMMRVLSMSISVLPGALGWLWAIFDREHRALHDHLAGTYVIVDEG